MTAKTKTERTIESIVYEGSQSINRREIYELGDLKIKLELKSDTFDIQSYANAYALDGLEWKVIYSIPYSLMKTPIKLHIKYENRINNAEKEFETDVQRLKKYIREILG